MDTEIVVAIITLLGTAIGTFTGITVNSKLTNYRIEQLEKKQDKHNSVIERVYKLEEDYAVIHEEISSINQRR